MSLSTEESLDYDVLKASVLRNYELDPEAYRQKYHNHVRAANQLSLPMKRELCLISGVSPAK